MLNIDLQAVQRLDQAMNIQFLTSSASVLHKHGLITPKETDNLRMTLSRLNTSQATSSNNSLLLDLDQSQNEILAILKYRFGTSGLGLNLVRLCMQRSLQPVIDDLIGCGEQLIRKSEIVFNRPLFIYFAGTPQYKTLASTFVIDLAEQLVLTATRLKESATRFGLMIPSLEPTGDDVGIDFEIAEALGFSGLTDCVLPSYEERTLIRQIHHTIFGFSEYCSDFAEQVIQNRRAEAGHNLLAASDVLKAECLRLSAISFPEGNAFTMWETRRRHLAANISSISEALKMVCSMCIEAVNFENSSSISNSDRESVKSRLVMQMIGSGTPINQAAKAALDILSYLKENKLAPSEVIAGELSRINPQLTVKCLELLQKDAGDAGVMQASTEMKKQALDRSKIISGRLKALAITVGLLIVFCPTIISCGHKTNPVNDAAEFRPDIPFKNASEKKPDYLIIPGDGATKTTNTPEADKGFNGNEEK